MNSIELAEAIAGALPPKIRAVLAEADDKGWVLNGKGCTICLRLDHPTDELAMPIYATWAVGETEKGNLSCRYMSGGTASLQPLTYDDVLKVIKDPTTIYPEWAEDAKPEQASADILPAHSWTKE